MWLLALLDTAEGRVEDRRLLKTKIQEGYGLTKLDQVQDMIYGNVLVCV